MQRDARVRRSSEVEALGSSNSGRTSRLLSKASAINHACRAAKSSRQANRRLSDANDGEQLDWSMLSEGRPPLPKGRRIVAPHERYVHLVRAD